MSGPPDVHEAHRRTELVIQDFEGIVPTYEAFYLQSIMFAAERALAAFEELDRALSAQAAAAYSFAVLQEALMHASALSRFFWPTRKAGKLAQARGEKLRKAFAEREVSVLQNRNLRNLFEHFDERLDRYLLQDLAGTVQPWPVIGQASDDAQGTLVRFKLLDPEAGLCLLLGETFAYKQFHDAVAGILEDVFRLNSGGCRLNLEQR